MQSLDNRRKSRYNIVLCELHFIPIHGKTKKSYEFIEGHFLLIGKFDGLTLYEMDDNDDLDDELEKEDIFEVQEFYKDLYSSDEVPRISHKTIRNYDYIINQPNYIKPEIGECIDLPTGELIVIIKTIWLRIIQLKWKSVYKKRQEIIQLRKNITALLNKQLTGRWSYDCLNMPSLRGMLSNLLK